MVAADGKQDFFHKKWLFSLGDGTYFPSRRMSAPHGRGNDSHALQQTRSGLKQVLLFSVSTDENGRRQFLFVQDDDHVIGRAGDRIGCSLIGYVVELQRITGHIYFEAAVSGRNGPYLEFGNTELDIFDSVALFIDNPPFDGDVLLCEELGREQQESCKQAIPHKCPPPSPFLPDRAGSPGCPPGRIPAPCRVC